MQNCPLIYARCKTIQWTRLLALVIVLTKLQDEILIEKLVQPILGMQLNRLQAHITFPSFLTPLPPK